MKKFLSIVLSLLIFSNLCYAYSDSYTVRDKYGRKISTYKTTGNTTVTISCNDQYINIVDGTATYGTMAPDATASSDFIVRADGNTPHEHEFNFNVTATNNGMTWNSSFSVSVNNDCHAPTNLAVEAVDHSTIELSWTPSSSANSYNIYRGGTLLTNTTTSSYTDTDLEPETQYCYTVRSMCHSGESGSAVQDCATTLEAPEPCLAPTGLDAIVEQDVPGYDYRHSGGNHPPDIPGSTETYAGG